MTNCATFPRHRTLTEIKLGYLMSDITSRSGGKLVVDSLRQHGVEWAFCVPGESYLEVLDALYDATNEITLVSARHEHGAANMAESYAKLTGRPGVCLVTRGPGACNSSIGVHTAFQDSTPMVHLIGQVPRRHAGREAFQEVDLAAMYAPLAKWSAQIDRTEEIPYYMARAFHTAVSGRPGPVVLALPEDVLSARSDVDDMPPLSVTLPAPASRDMLRLGDLLAKAERPLLYLGGGGWTSRAKAAIREFAEASDLPVCCSFRRHDLFDNSHQCFIGDVGIGTSPALLERVQQSDLILAVGTRLGEITTQGYTLLDVPNPHQTLIHVHTSFDELGRVYVPTLAIRSDMEAFAETVKATVSADANRWADWRADARASYETWQTPGPFQGELDLGQCMMDLKVRMTPDAVVTVDAGNFSGWAHRFLSFGGDCRLVGSTAGAMGYGVPAAVAAAITEPNRMAIAFVGDGGFGMTGQEIATAAAYSAAPLVLVFNNAMYGTIRMHQEREHPGRVSGTTLTNPDYADIARAHGGHGETVTRTEEFGPAVDRALASGKLAVLDIRMDPEIISTQTTLSAIRDKALARAGT